MRNASLSVLPVAPRSATVGVHLAMEGEEEDGLANVSTKHAVLGLMLERSVYGYWIQSQEGGLLESLNISESGAYKILERLEELGWIEVVGERPGSARGPKRVLFQATERGIEEFDRWMAGPVAEPQLRDDLLVRLLVSRDEDLSQIHHQARRQLDSAFERLAAMRLPELANLEASLSGPWRDTATVLHADLKARYLRARVDWLSHLCEVLDAFDSSNESDRATSG